MKPKSISAAEFDRLFDEGGDISPYVDWSKGRRPNLEIKRVNVDLPRWMITALDGEAERLGITRQSVIKTWIGEMIDARRAPPASAGSSKSRKVAETQRRYRAKKRKG